jgi:hypothetical protein
MPNANLRHVYTYHFSCIFSLSGRNGFKENGVIRAPKIFLENFIIVKKIAKSLRKKTLSTNKWRKFAVFHLNYDFKKLVGL